MNLFFKLSAACLPLVLLCGLSRAQQHAPVYYTVKPQEGLYRVAVNNNVTMAEIRMWNNLTSDNLTVGQKLIVGYGQTASSFNENPPEPEGSSFKKGSQPKYYIVQPQEGLYRVAVKNNVTMGEIRMWNNLATDNLSRGQRLIVGYIESPDEGEKTQTLYEEAIAGASKAYDEARYEDARYLFEEALAINPDSYYIKKRLREINNMNASLDQPAAQENMENAPQRKSHEAVAESAPQAAAHNLKTQDIAAIDLTEPAPKEPYAAFWFYIKRGDALMSAGHYEPALSQYKEAAKIYPAKSYPKTKITEIEDTLRSRSVAAQPQPHSTQDTAKEAAASTVLPPPVRLQEPQVPAPPAMLLPAPLSDEPILTQEKTEEEAYEHAVQAVTYFAILKSKPSDFSKVLCYLPANTQVSLLDYNRSMREYYKVSSNGIKGWVPRKNVLEIEQVKQFRKQARGANRKL